MRINHNIAALNTHRQLNTATTAQSKSMEKLASGMRINKAGDDAAGLAISEKMRGQIRGLDQASANAQDSISMIATAEGALNETHDILQRMRELSVQSANDTSTADDRVKIQSEVDELAKEITRISNTSEFNTQNLLAGGLNNTFHIGANEGQNISFSINAMDAQSLGVAGTVNTASTLTPTVSGVSNVSNVSRGLAEATGYKVVVDATASGAGIVATNKVTNTTNTQALVVTTGTDFTGTKDTAYTVKIASVDGAAAGNKATSIQYSKDGGNSWTTTSADMSVGVKIDGMTFTMAASVTGAYAEGDQYSFTATAAKATVQLQDSSSANIGGAQTVHYGDTSATIGSRTDGKTADVGFVFSSLADGTATFNVESSKSKAAVVSDGMVNSNAVTSAGIDVSNQKSSSAAITKINDAITRVSEERSKMGAVQNRLEHTINNLGTSSENLTAAESRIRDVDMAKEMMEQTKNSILSQAAQAMLAQANQLPQGVLQLLR